MMGPTCLFPVDIKHVSRVISHIVTTVSNSRSALNRSQDFASALETDDNRLMTDDNRLMTDPVCKVFSYEITGYVKLFSNRPLQAVPRFRRLVAGLSPRRPGFDPSSVHVGFVVGKVALEQVFPRVLRCSLVSFIPPVLHYTEKEKKTVIIFITGLHNKP
jgi:hypothetical protein